MDELVKSFKDEFQERVTPGDAYQKAGGLKQRENESVQAFVRRFEFWIPYMTTEIGMPSIIDGFLQGLKREITWAASQINCRDLPWSVMVKKLVDIERRLPKKVAKPFIEPVVPEIPRRFVGTSQNPESRQNQNVSDTASASFNFQSRQSLAEDKIENVKRFKKNVDTQIWWAAGSLMVRIMLHGVVQERKNC